MNAGNLVPRGLYPSVKRFLDKHVEMQFMDLRSMLRLPTDELQGGCNFAATAVLLNLLSGFSVCLYKANLSTRGDRGNRFKGMLGTYYPWQIGSEVNSKAEGSKSLYELWRNPLAHSLGIHPGTEWIGIWKSLLSASQIDLLECSSTPPSFLRVIPTGPTFIREPTSLESSTMLSVLGLYWGTWRLLAKLCQDQGQMATADRVMKAQGF